MPVPFEVAQDISAFREAAPWLLSFARGNRGARLDDYLRACERIERNTPSHRDLIALIDMQQLVRVYRWRDELAKLGDLDKRMRTAVGGATFYDLDVNHEPRNRLFELVCGCYMAALGMSVSRSTNGDLAALWLELSVLGECKRQNSLTTRATFDRIADASKQLGSRRLNCEPGIVFLDLTIAVNPALKGYDAKSDETAEKIAQENMNTNAALIFDRAMPLLSSSDDVCIACHATYPFWIESEYRWSVHERWLTMGNPSATQQAKNFYEHLCDAASRMKDY